MIREQENFLESSYFQEISSLICGNEFPWFYNENISYKNRNNNLNEHGLSHWIIHPNRPNILTMHQDFFMPLLLNIKIGKFEERVSKLDKRNSGVGRF